MNSINSHQLDPKQNMTRDGSPIKSLYEPSRWRLSFWLQRNLCSLYLSCMCKFRKALLRQKGELGLFAALKVSEWNVFECCEHERLEKFGGEWLLAVFYYSPPRAVAIKHIYIYNLRRHHSLGASEGFPAAWNASPWHLPRDLLVLISPGLCIRLFVILSRLIVYLF
jgi:hypothetical protein